MKGIDLKSKLKRFHALLWKAIGPKKVFCDT